MLAALCFSALVFLFGAFIVWTSRDETAPAKPEAPSAPPEASPSYSWPWVYVLWGAREGRGPVDMLGIYSSEEKAQEALCQAVLRAGPLQALSEPWRIDAAPNVAVRIEPRLKEEPPS